MDASMSIEYNQISKTIHLISLKNYFISLAMRCVSAFSTSSLSTHFFQFCFSLGSSKNSTRSLLPMSGGIPFEAPWILSIVFCPDAVRSPGNSHRKNPYSLKFASSSAVRVAGSLDLIFLDLRNSKNKSSKLLT